jgi:hypothetical protein
MLQLRDKSKHHAVDLSVGGNEPDVRAILEQLTRMLTHPLFKNSKRCPKLLQFVVERTIEGSKIELKERNLGVDVFGREPGYDTNDDPIVRVTAGEIRKRIAQYYHEPEHAGELRIELRSGSYLPEFHWAAAAAPVSRPEMNKGVVIAASSVLLALVFLSGGLLWSRFEERHSALDLFWRPVLDFPGPVMVCVGQRQFVAANRELPEENPDFAWFDSKPVAADPVNLFKLYYLGSQNVSFADAVAMGRVAGLLQAKGKECSFHGETSTTLSDLRSGPAVLVGAFNNGWTLGHMGTERFRFRRDKKLFWIEDRQNSSQRSRMVDYSWPNLSLTEDYALLSRAWDPTTERTAIVVAGLTGYGTQAAGEFLCNPAYLNDFARSAPSGWERRNVQLVLRTRVIRGSYGPPKVIDRHFW